MKRVWRRRVRGWVGYSVFLVIFLCVGMEVSARAYSWLFFPKMMDIDPLLGWSHAPNARKFFHTEGQPALVVHNNMGHRGPTIPPQKPPGATRVLVLGDSFTEGAQVNDEDLFTARIAARHPRLEVINAGVGGYGSVQEYLYLRERGLKLQPDIVVVMFYENDLYENCLPFAGAIGPRPYATIDHGHLRVIEDPSAEGFLRYALPAPFALSLNRVSLAYNFLNTRIYQPWRAEHLRRLSEDDLRKTADCPQMAILRLVYQEMQRLLRERGVKLLVALIPQQHEARAGVAERDGTILAICQQAGIPCLSLAEPLHAAYRSGAAPYFERDIHWTKAGHAATAAALGPFILEHAR